MGYCLNFSDDKNEPRTDDDNTTTNTNNNNNLYGNQKDQFTPNLTPLHRFYREQQQRKKMPGFRGRRGLCGCFQVRNMKYYFNFTYMKYIEKKNTKQLNAIAKFNRAINIS